MRVWFDSSVWLGKGRRCAHAGLGQNRELEEERGRRVCHGTGRVLGAHLDISVSFWLSIGCFWLLLVAFGCVESVSLLSCCGRLFFWGGGGGARGTSWAPLYMGREGLARS